MFPLQDYLRTKPVQTSDTHTEAYGAKQTSTLSHALPETPVTTSTNEAYGVIANQTSSTVMTNPPDMPLSTTANAEYYVIPNQSSSTTATNPPDVPLSMTANAAYGVTTHGEYDVIPNERSSTASNPSMPLSRVVVQGQGTGGGASTHENDDDGQIYEN